VLFGVTLEMKETTMLWKCAFSIGIVLMAAVAPLHAQSNFTAAAGGGITTPLNPTGAYAGLSGNFVSGAGYSINRNNAIVGEFMWAGLPPNRLVLDPVRAPSGRVSLYSLTVNYRAGIERIHDSPFGLYVIGGGGWYYRYATVDKDYVVGPNVPCLPIYTWWGYACTAGGYVYSETVAYKGVSAGGFNAGAGFTIRLSDSDMKFFTESRYHYAYTERIPTTLLAITFGIRFN
jgi:hypothetical protein